MRFFDKYKSDGFFWFRILGYGIVGKDLNKHSLLFSEKVGKTKKIIILNWCFRILKPNNK